MYTFSSKKGMIEVKKILENYYYFFFFLIFGPLRPFTVSTKHLYLSWSILTI